MESLTLKQRLPMQEPEIEDWDDGDFANLDDIQLRAASTTTSIASAKQSHRDSGSSRLSIRSDSNNGDENWDIHVGESDPVKDAIAIAKSKGIPIPSNVPRSALVGGTIRRMNGEKIQKAIADDWDEDLDFAGSTEQLRLTKNKSVGSPDALRQISDGFSPKRFTTHDNWDDDFSSPETRKIFQLEKIETTDERGTKRLVSEARLRQISAAFASKASRSSEGTAKLFDDVTIKSPKSRNKTSILDRFQDTADDAGFGDFGTIKVAKQRSPQKASLFTSMQPPGQSKTSSLKPRNEDDDFADGLVLPNDGQLKLSSRKLPHTPEQHEELDLEWADAGSLGTRNAGKRDGRSNRSSSASALSPSVSSAFTAESEDEGLDGLILPAGPIQFEEALKRRRENGFPDRASPPRGRFAAKPVAIQEEDDFAGLELGDGAVFDSAKLTLNRNIKHKTQRPTSPSKRATTTLNFTSTKSQSTISRLPRFQPAHDRHERARSNLEPVSETGAPISRYRRPDSRLGGHSAQSSVSSIPAPLIPSQPSTPSRRGLRSAESRENLRYEPPTTTNAQLLKAKRSMPVMNRGRASPTKSTTFGRSESRQGVRNIPSRLNLPARPKTPTERAESRLGARNSAPFLPAGASAGQSQHISIKSGRHYKRNDSDGSNEGGILAQRPMSRLGGRPETPGRRGSLTPAELAAQAKKPITKPARRRNFGDGTELEIFDDLPTSATVESRFSKAPIGYGAPKSLFRKIGQSHQAAAALSLSQASTLVASTRSGTETPMPQTPLSPVKQDFRLNNNRSVPRFMQETATSRNAREQRQISVAHGNAPPAFQNMRGEPLQPLSTNSHWKSSTVAGTARAPTQSPTLHRRMKKKGQQKPFLIKQIGGDINRPKTEKGMQYNPVLFRWEGNENALVPFDVPDFHPRGQSPGGSPNSKPPALITNMNVGQAGGVQVVGGMVFDPRRMCWLKMAGAEHQVPTNNRSVGSVTLEEEEDVFAGLEDLKEEDETASRRSHYSSHPSTMGPITPSDRQVSGETHGSGDETMLIEEFDVGPEFVRKQRHEESRWREKVSMWIGNRQEPSLDDTSGWRWAIRDIAADY
jgi:hypothetical protein